MPTTDAMDRDVIARPPPTRGSRMTVMGFVAAVWADAHGRDSAEYPLFDNLVCASVSLAAAPRVIDPGLK